MLTVYTHFFTVNVIRKHDMLSTFYPILLAWHMQPGYVRPIRHYRIDPKFCDSVRGHFYEDWFFTWRMFSCRDIDTMIRHAFDAWQYNSETVVYETHNASGADVVIGTGSMGEREWIAFARRYTSGDNENEIRMDLDTCWYTDRHFCYAVNRDFVPLCIGLGITWVAFVIIAFLNLLNRPDPYVSVPRILAWVVVMAIPTLALGSFLPCLMCHDFTAVVIHEVGHILGFGHSDDPAQMCGCGGTARACTSREDTASVMHSVAQRRNTLCLSRDDVDGVRSIYGGICDDPIWCYESPSTTGYTRVSTALLYSFIIASLIVFVRNRFIAHRRTRQAEPPPIHRIALTRPPPRGRTAPMQHARSMRTAINRI